MYGKYNPRLQVVETVRNDKHLRVSFKEEKNGTIRSLIRELFRCIQYIIYLNIFRVMTK